MAQLVDWDALRADALEQGQAGWPKLSGNQVFMDIVIGTRTEQSMRLVFCLFEQTPLAFANFHALCTHSQPGLGQAGQMLTYKRTKIHKIIKGAAAATPRTHCTHCARTQR